MNIVLCISIIAECVFSSRDFLLQTRGHLRLLYLLVAYADSCLWMHCSWEAFGSCSPLTQTATSFVPCLSFCSLFASLWADQGNSEKLLGRDNKSIHFLWMSICSHPGGMSVLLLQWYSRDYPKMVSFNWVNTSGWINECGFGGNKLCCFQLFCLICIPN